MKVSAIIIAKNEAEMIGDGLESVLWADEIIVIDSGSVDKTIDIAKRYGAKIYKTRSGSFSDWRKQGAKRAQGEYLFYLDADERVTPLLRAEIKKAVSDESAPAYAIPRKNILLGHEMHWGGWWPDYVIRLIKATALISWKGELHEYPEISGEVIKLRQPLIHITHTNLTEMVEKTNYWSETEARLLFESGHPPVVWWRFVSIAFREFWFRGIRKMAFLDGPVGIIELIYQIFNRLIIYAKLWEFQQNQGKK
ncbi:hypothetical protein A2115_03430 [Candidatus Woesebacteria bacterium GWA1_41_8]|uniref:Glycosyltransferase 2-like domain-containing protein n=1 Tax=Candidatus Woesebacteria bacterium GWA1_41_8 TaxID=1802471 RepID=A0A1F7WM81_9BACT|nr:MAG: hypothetical protein A2115_03430 [Candidatus Woesebacteria bacterium GWA1_41_8]